MSTSESNKEFDSNKRVDERLPVTVLSGFLGAGKTSVLQNILHSSEHKMKIAVIVNDMAAVNIDANSVIKVAPKLVAMQNGCICCNLREDLLQQVTELSKEKDLTSGERKWAYLVIESTGISEPLPVAQTFVMEVNQANHEHEHAHNEDDKVAESGKEDEEIEEVGLPVLTENPLLKYARLDTMVTVVDACNFFRRLSELQKVKDQPDAEGNEDESRTLANLMVDQVEFANVILLNKCDVLIADNKTKELDEIEALLKRLNPKSIVIRTNYGKVPFDKILNTHLFDMNEAQASAGWIEELLKPAHAPETEEYGVSSFVFRANRPFHPKRLSPLLDGFEKNDESSLFKGVIRSKGQIWLANAFSLGFAWQSAGYQFHLTPANFPFLATFIEKELDVPYLGKASDPQQVEAAIEKLFGADEYIQKVISRLRENGLWCSEYGDRNQEIVFIGVHLNKEKLKAGLEEALLNDKEMKAGMADMKTWMKKLEDLQKTMSIASH